MDKPIIKERRKSIRIPLLSEVIDYFTIDGWKQYKMYDISSEGVYLEISGHDYLPPIGDIREVAITLPGELGRCYLLAEVVRVTWATKKKDTRKKGFAVKLLPKGSEQKIIESLTVYLRNKQIITVSKRIIEEFFGSKK